MSTLDSFDAHRKITSAAQDNPILIPVMVALWPSMAIYVTLRGLLAKDTEPPEWFVALVRLVHRLNPVPGKRILIHLHRLSPGWLRLPECIVVKNGFLLIETSRGLPRLQRFARRVPRSWWRIWSNTAIVLALSLVVLSGWLVTLIVGLTAIEIGEFILSIRLPPLRPRTLPTPTINLDYTALLVSAVHFTADFLYFIAVAFVGYLLLSIYMTVALLVISPGLALHEFGHVAAATRVGADVESYGLFLLGTMPVGAFVRPADGWLDEATGREKLEVYSLGVFHSLVYGAFIGTAGVALFLWADQPVLGLALALLGLLEYGNAALNSFPVLLVDGGQIVRAVLTDYCGLGDVMEAYNL